MLEPLEADFQERIETCLKIADDQPLSSAWLGAMDLLDERMARQDWNPHKTVAVIALLRRWQEVYKPRMQRKPSRRPGDSREGFLIKNPGATPADMLSAFSDEWAGPGPQGNFPLWLGARFLDGYLTMGARQPETASKMRQLMEMNAGQLTGQPMYRLEVVGG